MIYRTQWTPDMDAKLRQMIAGGITYVRIAKAMGVSKNAIAGRAKRLGIRSEYRPAANRSETQTPPKRRRKKPAPKPQPSPATGAEPVAIPSLKLTLVGLGAQSCKFPTHEENGMHLFCGNEADEGSPYCAWHRSIAYVKPSDYRAEPRKRNVKSAAWHKR